MVTKNPIYLVVAITASPLAVLSEQTAGIVLCLFLPGLHTKEDAEILLPQTITKKQARVLPKEVPEGLLEDFIERKKNPISCLMEYCASARLIAT